MRKPPSKSRPKVSRAFISKVKKRANGRCEYCGKKRRLTVHHRRWPLCWYPEDAEDESMVDIICKKCHRAEHKGRKSWLDEKRSRS